MEFDSGQSPQKCSFFVGSHNFRVVSFPRLCVYIVYTFAKIRWFLFLGRIKLLGLFGKLELTTENSIEFVFHSVFLPYHMISFTGPTEDQITKPFYEIIQTCSSASAYL
jgi:hypothetical protein